MSLSTKNVKTSEGGLPKTIQPGNTSGKILGVSLQQPSFLQDKGGYFVVLEIVGPKPSDDFEGFLVDKDVPDGPRYEGPVGRVKASRWAFQDGQTKTGVDISRNNEIMKFVKNLCDELGMQTWWNDADEKYETIEDFIEAFNSDAPFKDKMVEFCIAGREYYNAEGYVNHDLYLPKFSKAGIPFEIQGKEKSRLLVFDEETHVDKATPANVDKFEGDDTDTPAAGDTGMDIPEGEVPEFEL